MTDTVTSPVPATASPVAKKLPAKKKAAAVSKDKKAAPTHPATSVMVTAAIKELKEKKGSSLPAIKKYMAANYKVDPAKLAPFIRKFLKAAVINGAIVQTKGTGASGHFKLPVAEVKPKKVAAKKKAPIAKKIKAAGTPKKKKSVVPKKVKSSSGEPAAKKPKKTPAKPKAAAAKPKKSPAKPKKPATKPKAAVKSKQSASKKTLKKK